MPYTVLHTSKGIVNIQLERDWDTTLNVEVLKTAKELLKYGLNL